jgi:hypothetical protein
MHKLIESYTDWSIEFIGMTILKNVTRFIQGYTGVKFLTPCSLVDDMEMWYLAYIVGVNDHVIRVHHADTRRIG